MKESNRSWLAPLAADFIAPIGDECSYFNQRAEDATNASSELSPKTATAAAITSSKLVSASVKEWVAD